jgi:apolipoprotein N-acyltransferase
MAVVVCGIASAVLFFLREYYWPLAWIAPIPLLWLAYSQRPFRAVFAATAGAVALPLSAVVAEYVAAGGGQAVPPAPILALMIVSMILANTACLAAARVARRNLSAVWTVLAYPLLWTSVSYVTLLAAGGDSYGLPAYSQVDAPALIQSASVFGLWGIEFLLALFANAVTLAYSDRQHRLLYSAVAIGGLLGNLAFGLMRLHEPTGATVRVAVAAQDIPLTERLPLGADRVPGITAGYAAEARSLAARGAQYIVFPELTSVLTPEWRERALEPLAAAARDTGTRITMGFADVNGVGEVRNVALTFSPQGDPVGYVKRHTLRPLDTSIRGDAAGMLSEGRAVAICKDLDFPATIRSDARLGIQLMLVPAADFQVDGWIHARMAILRGVENGFSIARAARNGLLTLSDDRGRVWSRATTERQRIVAAVADLPLGTGPTIYRRFGDFFAWMCTALSVALLAHILLRHKQGISMPKPPTFGKS